MIHRVCLVILLMQSVPMQATAPRALGDMQQCLHYLRAGKAHLALCALQSLRDAPSISMQEADAAHLLSIANALIAEQASKLSALAQQALGECIGLLNALELETSAISSVVIARATNIIRLALSILVMHALENISLHIPHA